MRLITYYKSCKKKTPIQSNGIQTRFDLVDKYGLDVPYQCKHCLQTQTTHPNQVYAHHSKAIMLITSLIGLLFIWGVFFISTFDKWLTAILYGIGGTIMSAGFVSYNGSNARIFSKSII